MTIVCSCVIKVAGIEASPMATLLVFIIGLLPLSCHHSEHCSSRGIVLWDSTQLGWLQLQNSSLLHAAATCPVARNSRSSPLFATEGKKNYNRFIKNPENFLFLLSHTTAYLHSLKLFSDAKKI